MQSANGRWWYRHNNGTYTKNGWEYINGKWYYFKINSPNSGVMLTGWRNVKYLNYYSGKPYYNYFNSNGAFVTDSDYKGCNHGYPTFGDCRYTISPKKVKYYSKCSKDQNEEIAKGAAAWSNDMAQVTKASKASEANMFYYPVRFSQKEVLARTSYNITGSWTTNKTGNWKSTRIQVDNDRGIMKSGVIAHEIGHEFGLYHRITNKNSIMCQTQYGRKVQTVQNTDWETFKHIYGY